METVLALLIFGTAIYITEKKSFHAYGFFNEKIVSSITKGFLKGSIIPCFFLFALVLGHHYQLISSLPRQIFIWAQLSSLSASIGEELVFRGYIFQTLERSWGTKKAFIVSVSLFAIYHIGGLEYGTHILRAIINASLLGILFSSAYLSGRCLWFPIGLHWGYDTLSILIFGSAGIPSLYNYQLVNPSWVTGGSVGIGASPIIVILILTVSIRFILIAYHTKKLSVYQNFK